MKTELISKYFSNLLVGYLSIIKMQILIIKRYYLEYSTIILRYILEAIIFI